MKLNLHSQFYQNLTIGVVSSLPLLTHPDRQIVIQISQARGDSKRIFLPINLIRQLL